VVIPLVSALAMGGAGLAGRRAFIGSSQL